MLSSASSVSAKSRLAIGACPQKSLSLQIGAHIRVPRRWVVHSAFAAVIAVSYLCQPAIASANHGQSRLVRCSRSEVIAHSGRSTSAGFVRRGVARALRVIRPLPRLIDTLALPGHRILRKSTSLRGQLAELRAAHLKAGAQNVRIPVAGGGLTLDALYYEPETTTTRTVIACNSNAGFMEKHRRSIATFVQDLGCNLLLFNYRGYGESEGRPGVRTMATDMTAIYDWLRETHQRTPEDVLVYGRSIGAAAAAYLAATTPGMTLVCDRAFANLHQAAIEKTKNPLLSPLAGLLVASVRPGELDTEHHARSVGKVLSIVDHDDEHFNNLRVGDVLELHTAGLNGSHDDTASTFESPLFRQWIREAFLSAGHDGSPLPGVAESL